jgi:XTP/dITP diphosphohydrolase
MNIVLATNNQHKADELYAILKGENIPLELLLISSVLPDGLEVDETGHTLEENAYLKAIAIHTATGLPCIADDTGLEVSALGGQPGVFSARYAGANATYDDNVNLLLKNLDGIEERSATFRTVVCYVDGLRTFFAEGICTGRIIKERKGSGGFGYDPVFMPDGYSETFAELSSEVKNAISHRGNAIKNFTQRWKSYYID